MRKPRKWLVDSIIPANEFHIIAGPSGAGKTTWAAQFLKSWQQGEAVFGHRSYPIPFVYVACDRGAADIEETLTRVGIDLDSGEFPYYSLLDSDLPINSIGELLSFVRKAIPEVKVLVIDGLAMLAPGGSHSMDYVSVSKFVRGLSRLCHKEEITLIAIMHSPKTKEKDRYSNPRQRILGSVAWAAISNCVILIEPDEENPTGSLRKLYLLPRNAPEEVFDMQLDKDGLLVPAKSVAAGESMDLWLELQEATSSGRTFTTSEVIEAGDGVGLSERAVKYWLRQAQDAGRITKVEHGKYIIPRRA